MDCITESYAQHDFYYFRSCNIGIALAAWEWKKTRGRWTNGNGGKWQRDFKIRRTQKLSIKNERKRARAISFACTRNQTIVSFAAWDSMDILWIQRNLRRRKKNKRLVCHWHGVAQARKSTILILLAGKLREQLFLSYPLQQFFRLMTNQRLVFSLKHTQTVRCMIAKREIPTAIN